MSTYNPGSNHILPYRGFKWVEFTLEEMYIDRLHGYLIEADVFYVQSRHNIHNELPCLSTYRHRNTERVVINNVYKNSLQLRN